MESTWILVANTVQAKILQIDAKQSEIIEIKDFFHPKANKTVIDDFLAQQQQLKNKKPMLPSNDFGENIDAHEREVFAKEIAHFLGVSFDLNKYKKLVVVSPQNFLGDLRQAFNNNTKKHVVYELTKDLFSLRLNNKELISKILNDLGLNHF